MYKNRFLLVVSILLSGTISASTVAQESANATQAEVRPYLGVHVTELPAPLAAHLPAETKGILIASVMPHSPAEQSGLLEFDVVTSVGDQLVESATRFAEAIRAHQPGDQLTLNLIRGGNAMTLEVVLGEVPIADTRFTTDRDMFRVPWVSPWGHWDELPLGMLDRWDPMFDTEFTTQNLRMVMRPDGQCRVNVEFSKDGETIRREYQGSQAEVRAAIEADDELPQSIQQSLLHSMNETRSTHDTAHSFWQRMGQRLRSPVDNLWNAEMKRWNRWSQLSSPVRSGSARPGDVKDRADGNRGWFDDVLYKF